MRNLTRLVAVGVMGLGLVVVAIGVANLQRANEGLASLDAVYEAQNVTLAYNDEGQLIDRGSTEEAQAILALLEDEWNYPVNHADLDAADPLVNTPTELMYQYAVITYHVLNGTHTVTLAEDVEYNGEAFAAGSYEVPVDGRYWTDFDRMHPLEGPVREMAWGGSVHGLLASIAAGVNADYQAGFAHFAAWRTMIIGLAFALAGFGLFTVTMRTRETATATEDAAERDRALVS